MLIAALAALLALGSPAPARSSQRLSPRVPGLVGPLGVVPIPESERKLQRVIIGLVARKPRYMLLPDTESLEPGRNHPRAEFLRDEFYGLIFELQHGQIFQHAPPHTRFFVAVPERGGEAAWAGSAEYPFRRYLERRAGWSKAQIAERIRFFPVPTEVPYAQDMAQAVGYDGSGRLVYALGLDCPDSYREALESIVRRFPNEFDLRRLPGISTEGGDLDIVALPRGGVGLLLGQNRIRRYLEFQLGESLEGKPIAAPRIEEAKQAFRKAFGLETTVISEQSLTRPALHNKELFHLDMLAAIFDGTAGVVAFVPTYRGAVVDALTHVRLPQEMISRLEAEYERVAAQLAGKGYRVVRLPFADHPVRSPVNVAKFRDPATGKQFVMLGRYPYHLDLPGGINPQRTLHLRFEELDRVVAAWRNSRTDANWKIVQKTVKNVWAELDRAAASPNPIFDEQRRLYESNGVAVWPIPIFPTGEGGIHCLVLE